MTAQVLVHNHTSNFLIGKVLRRNAHILLKNKQGAQALQAHLDALVLACRRELADAIWEYTITRQRMVKEEGWTTKTKDEK
jgi:hypothetical protein